MSHFRRSCKQPVEARIESLSHEGRGVAHVDGKITFIDGALPGERVIFRYTRRRGRFDEGTTLQVLAPASERAAPRCSHFGVCGGCSLQHLRSEIQIVHKEAVMLEQLQHIGAVRPLSVSAPLTGPLWAYRRKARLAVKYVEKKGGVLVGFREKRTSYVADLFGCEVLDPKVGHKLPELRTLIGRLTVYDKIPQIEVACGDEICALVFRHLVPLTAEDKQRLKEFGERHGLMIYSQSGGVDSVSALWPEQPAPLSYALGENEPVIYFEPMDFTQVNADLNRAMLHRVLALLALDGTDRVLELFSGLGNFTLPMARRVAHVTAVEGDNGLVRRAKANAECNGIGNIEFHAIDLSDPGMSATFFTERFDKLLLDPPRSGAQVIIGHLGYHDVRRLVYVSCNPGTLARDAGVLVAEKGFRLVSCGVMDMFPHTAHVESIALFERR